MVLLLLGTNVQAGIIAIGGNIDPGHIAPWGAISPIFVPPILPQPVPPSPVPPLLGSNVRTEDLSFKIYFRFPGGTRLDPPIPDPGPSKLTASQWLAEQTAAAIPAVDFYTTCPVLQPVTDAMGHTVDLYYPNDPAEKALLASTTTDNRDLATGLDGYHFYAYQSSWNDTITSAIPEPSSLALLASGLMLGLLWLRRRR